MAKKKGRRYPAPTEIFKEEEGRRLVRIWMRRTWLYWDIFRGSSGSRKILG
jgi:hypothetical protein